MSNTRRFVLEIFLKIILAIIGAAVLFYFISGRTDIFLATANNYYDLFAQVVPGIITLAAFLGALVIFDVRRYEDATQKYADSVVDSFEDEKDKKLFAIKILRLHKSVLDTTDACHKLEKNDYIKKMREGLKLLNNNDVDLILGDMHEFFNQEHERRTLMTELVVLSFIYIFLAIFFIPLKSLLKDLPFISGTGIFSNLIIIGCILFDTGKLIRKIIGHSRFHKWSYL